MAQKYTEKKKISNRRWDAANLDRISITVQKGHREEIKAHADSMGESLNRFIQRAVDETMDRDKKRAP